MCGMKKLLGVVVVVVFSSAVMAAAPAAKGGTSRSEPYPNSLGVYAMGGDINGAGLSSFFKTGEWLLGVDAEGGYDVYAKAGGGGADVTIGHDWATYNLQGTKLYFYLTLGGGYYEGGVFRSGLGAMLFFNKDSAEHPFGFNFDLGYRYHEEEEHGVAGTVALTWLPKFFQF